MTRQLLACLLALVLALVLTPEAGCVHAPPTLSPAGVAAFNNTRLIKGLDLLRDTAIDASAQIPPLIPVATTRRVVRYHESALKLIQASASGWQAALTTGLDELVRDLPASHGAFIAPYVALVKTILMEVSR